MLKFIQIDTHILNIESFAVGYKIQEKEYYELNYLLTVIYFVIYKSHYVSNKKEKNIDSFKILKKEILDIVFIKKLRKSEKGKIFEKISHFFHE